MDPVPKRNAGCSTSQRVTSMTPMQWETFTRRTGVARSSCRRNAGTIGFWKNFTMRNTSTAGMGKRDLVRSWHPAGQTGTAAWIRKTCTGTGNNRCQKAGAPSVLRITRYSRMTSLCIRANGWKRLDVTVKEQELWPRKSHCPSKTFVWNGTAAVTTQSLNKERRKRGYGIAKKKNVIYYHSFPDAVPLMIKTISILASIYEIQSRRQSLHKRLGAVVRTVWRSIWNDSDAFRLHKGNELNFSRKGAYGFNHYGGRNYLSERLSSV